MVEIVVETEIRPTEDIEKIKKALSTITTLENLSITEISGGFKVMRVKCTSIRCLEPLRNTAKIQQIEPALKSYLHKYREINSLRILIHKQAAFAGRISLIDSDRESPLGPIRVEINGEPEEIESLIKYLTGD